MTRRSFRLRASLGSLYVFVAGWIGSVCFGATVAQGLGAAAGCAIGGLLAWWVYHLTSGRNNGLVFLGMNLALAFREPKPFLPTVIISTVTLVPIAWIAGRYSGSGKKAATRVADQPLYDAATDWA